jgi:short-subunit dehydrogenase
MAILPGTALITGATAGIGAEFSRQLAARGHDLVLVARDAARLESLASQLRASGVAVEVLPADLADAAGVERVTDRIADASRPIEVVVNNAGFGLHTDFDLSPVEDELRLLEVLVSAPLRLSHAALRAMVSRGHGTVINVTSIAAYAPLGPYSSSKSWLHFFTRWANAFYRPAGVTLTALAPGFVRTEFHERMNVERSSMAPNWLWLDVEPLVRRALRDADRGRAVSVPSVRYRLISLVASLVPMWLVTRAAKRDRWNRPRG